jgi:hypothetical protein
MYVLGPPKNKLLNKNDPSSGAKKEVYFGNTTSMTGFVKGLLKMGGVEQGFDDGSPFANVNSISAKEGQKG